MQIVEPGKARFIDISQPEVNATDILLKIHYIGYCGSDLNAYKGLSPMAKFPLIPGHEICGEIVSMGEEVSGDYHLGDIVTVKPYFNCGNCVSCRNGKPNACRYNQTLGVQRDGALCEYIAVEQSHVIVCNDMDFENVALIEPLSVGFHLSNRCEIREGEYVAVIGCGAVGLGAVAAAVYQNARVIAIDIADGKLELARKLGAEFVINSMKENPLEKIQEITSDDGVAVALETAGTEQTCLLAVDVASFTGRVGIVSYFNAPVSYNTKLFVSKELNIMGSRNARDEFYQVIDMIRNKPEAIHSMVTKVYEFSDAIKALEDWKAHPEEITKILIKVD